MPSSLCNVLNIHRQIPPCGDYSGNTGGRLCELIEVSVTHKIIYAARS